MIAPPRLVPCPPRNLGSECPTMSAPESSGICARRATEASASRSQMLPAGLPTVSQNSARVSASMSEASSEGVSDLGERPLDPEPRQNVREERMGRAIKLRHRDDVLAGLGEIQQGVVDRRLAGGDGEGIDPTLEDRK